MEQETNEQITEMAQPVATEQEQGATKTDISLGKFKDVQALLNAYNSLQAEFTKRSQRLKEIEGAFNDKATAPLKEEGELKANFGITEEGKRQILQDYLKGVIDSESKVAILRAGGVGVKTPPEKPKSIQEAGRLAKEIL